VIVVADTSVVLNLCFLGLDPLLPQLFGEIYAPAEVESEFLRLVGEDARFEGLAFPKAIVIETPRATGYPWAKSPSLHPGEVAALSLALELRADLVLMDEAEGRAVASTLDLATMGLLGVLLPARQLSRIPSVAPLLERLDREARFWMAPSLRAAVLRAAGEMPGDDS
jgi:predicted nucleic acid-binding protein